METNMSEMHEFESLFYQIRNSTEPKKSNEVKDLTNFLRYNIISEKIFESKDSINSFRMKQSIPCKASSSDLKKNKPSTSEPKMSQLESASTKKLLLTPATNPAAPNF